MKKSKVNMLTKYKNICKLIHTYKSMSKFGRGARHNYYSCSYLIFGGVSL